MPDTLYYINVCMPGTLYYIIAHDHHPHYHHHRRNALAWALAHESHVTRTDCTFA